MWPLYSIFTKNHKAEDGKQLKGDMSGAIDPYHFQHPPIHTALPRSRFVEVPWVNCLKLKNKVICHTVEVPHINQSYTWDCGLACVLMVLKTIGVNSCNIQELADLCRTTSIWTVDLAYLLQRFSVSFCYFTVTFGANPNYCVESFYKEQLPNDLERVDKLFQKAVEAGINIQRRSVRGEEISSLILSGRHIAIALVDHNKLSNVWQEDVQVQTFFCDNSSYTGHYVLICGYDAGADMFEIRDPASSKKQRRISSKSLEEARKAFGTDEDLLLISIEKSKSQHQLCAVLPIDVNSDS